MVFFSIAVTTIVSVRESESQKFGKVIVTLNCHAKEIINTLLTEHCEIHFGISGWWLFEVHSTPVHPAIGFPDTLHRQLGRIVSIPEERSSTQNLLVWPVLRLVERFPSRVETATWHKFQLLCTPEMSFQLYFRSLFFLSQTPKGYIRKRRPTLRTR